MTTKTKRSASVAASDLGKALKFARQPIEKRNTVPVLGMVAMRFDMNRLTISGTDLDVWCEQTVDAWTVAPLSFCMTPDRLAGIVAAANGERVEFVLDGEICRVTAGDFSATFRSILTAEDFPDFLESSAHSITTIAERDLHQILGDTIPCISTEEARYYLNGVYMHRDGSSLKAVATDGHRIAVRTTEVEWPAELNGIIPTKAAKILYRAMRGNGNATLQIRGYSDRQVVMPDSGDWVIRYKPIDGTFPDYTHAIPKDDHNMSVPVSLGMINRALAFVKGGGWWDSDGRSLKFDLSAKEISVALNDGSSVRFPISGCRGDGKLGVNGFYLRDFLRLHSPAVLKVKDESSPIIFETEDPRLKLIVMPMRIK